MFESKLVILSVRFSDGLAVGLGKGLALDVAGGLVGITLDSGDGLRARADDESNTAINIATKNILAIMDFIFLSLLPLKDFNGDCHDDYTPDD